MTIASLQQLTPAIVAIDGPAASGKSTVGYRLAELADFLFFDTGIMYRAVTWGAHHHNIDVNRLDAVGELATRLQIDIAPPDTAAADGRQSTVLVDGEDVTWQIRTPAVDQHVSAVAANPAVRQALTKQQRRIGLHYGAGHGIQVGKGSSKSDGKIGIVMVGRDIGTVVVPEAPLKIYMVASPEERARRRCRDQNQRGKTVDYAQVLADIRRRDKIDGGRTLAPMRAADDAVMLDTSALSIDDVIAKILAIAKDISPPHNNATTVTHAP